MESLLLYLSSFLYSVLWARHYQRRDRIRPRSQSTFSQVSWAFIIMLFPIILSCYRYGIGVDYENYVSLFENFHSSTWTSFSEENLSFEYANKALSDLGFYLTGDTFGVFGVYAVLTLVLLELALINYKDYISLPIATFIMLLLMYSMSLNIVRQALAIAVVFYSLKFIQQKKPLHYFIGCLFATGIHSTAFITLSFYFPKDADNTKYKFLFNNIVKVIIVLFPLLFTLLIGQLQSYVLLEKYFDNYDQEGASIIESYILKLPVLIPLLLNYKTLNKNKHAKFLYYLFAIELILLSIASIYKWAFRLSYYSFIGQILLVGMLVNQKTHSSALYKPFFCIYYLLYFYLLFFVWGRDGIFPYSHIN